MRKLSFFLLSICIANALAAQWTTSPYNSNDIYNTNSGNVGVRLNNPVYPFQVWDGGTDAYSGIGLIPGSSPAQNAVIKALKSFNYGLLLRAESENSGWTQAVIHLKCGSATATSQTTVMSNFIDLRTGTGYNDIITDNTFGTSALYINNNQQVGIGTTSPGSFKLAVEGALGARSVKVTLTNPWPDYVFDKSHNLPPLNEVEQFIHQYQHLPEVPTAAEVAKDGVDLGQNQALLLKKVEELTLYLIEQQKQLQLQQKQIDSLIQEIKRK